MEAEIAYLGRGDGPVGDWNAVYPMGTKVRWSGKTTKTRSGAWSDDGGGAVVLVVGSLIPVPLDSVAAMVTV